MLPSTQGDYFASLNNVVSTKAVDEAKHVAHQQQQKAITKLGKSTEFNPIDSDQSPSSMKRKCQQTSFIPMSQHQRMEKEKLNLIRQMQSIQSQIKNVNTAINYNRSSIKQHERVKEHINDNQNLPGDNNAPTSPQGNSTEAYLARHKAILMEDRKRALQIETVKVKQHQRLAHEKRLQQLATDQAERTKLEARRKQIGSRLQQLQTEGQMRRQEEQKRNRSLKEVQMRKQLFMRRVDEEKEKKKEIEFEREQQLGQRRLNYKPLDIQDILEHGRRYSQLREEMLVEKQNQRMRQSQQIDSYQPSYIGRFYMRAREQLQPNDTKNELYTSRLKQYSQQVKQLHSPKVSAEQREKITNYIKEEKQKLREKKEREDAALEKLKEKGKQYTQFLRDWNSQRKQAQEGRTTTNQSACQNEDAVSDELDANQNTTNKYALQKQVFKKKMKVKEGNANHSIEFKRSHTNSNNLNSHKSRSNHKQPSLTAQNPQRTSRLQTDDPFAKILKNTEIDSRQKAVLLQHQSARLQQQLKRKEQRLRLLKEGNQEDIDEIYFKMVKAKMDLLHSNA